MSEFLLFVVAAGFLLGSVSTLRAFELQHLRASLVSFELIFPRRLEAEAVERLLGGLSGLLPPWWRRALFGSPFVVFETRATAKGITHVLLVPESWSATIENLLEAHAAPIRFRVVETDAPPVVTVGAEYRLSTGRRALRKDAPALSARMLTSLQPLSADEAVVLQWSVTPAGPIQPARLATPEEKQRFALLRRANALATAEEVSALREKQADPLLLGTGRIATRARSVGRARAMLRQVEAAWHSTRAPGVHLRRRFIGERWASRRLSARRVPLLSWPAVLNSSELSGLIAWPIEAEQIAGLVLGSSRVLAPSPEIPATGSVVAVANFPGSERPLALDVEARLRHLHALGPTGVGKSTLLLGLLEQDLAAGRSIVALDFKGDLIADLLRRIPPQRHDDIVVMDPADKAPLGLNPLLSVDEAHGEVVVENLVGAMRAMFGSAWGPRSDDLVRGSLRTLVATGDFTLCEVAPLLLDPAFRRQLVARLDDPSLLEFWAWYDALSDAERVNITSAPMNKLRAFVMRPAVRAIVGQAKPAIAMHDVLKSNKVLLVSLAAGLLGTEAAALLGALVFSELWHSTLARAGIAVTKRAPVMAYLDEFQEVVRLPVPMATVLAEARGLGVGYVLSHQHVGQLDRDLRAAVLANARSKVVFQLAAQDARLLAREMGGGLTPDDLQGLGAFEIAAQLFAAGRTQAPVTGRTLPPSAARSDGVAVRRLSRQRYGVKRSDVEEAIRARQQTPRSDAPIGRKRRSTGGSP